MENGSAAQRAVAFQRMRFEREVAGGRLGIDEVDRSSVLDEPGATQDVCRRPPALLVGVLSPLVSFPRAIGRFNGVAVDENDCSVSAGDRVVIYWSLNSRCRFHCGGRMARVDKALSIPGETGAIARTLHTYKRDDAIPAFRWDSHTTVAKREIQRLDGRLIAKNGDDCRMTEKV